MALLQKQTPDDFVVTHGITDEAFIRGKVPMTKEEVRSISVSKCSFAGILLCMILVPEPVLFL